MTERQQVERPETTDRTGIAKMEWQSPQLYKLAAQSAETSANTGPDVGTLS